jgi:hypothetical protein
VLADVSNTPALNFRPGASAGPAGFLAREGMYERILPSAGGDSGVKRLTIRIAVFALLHSLNPFPIEFVSHFCSFQKAFSRSLPLYGMAD